MLQRLLDPVASAQLLAAAMLAVLFLQSGLDKVLDFRGNLSWLEGHFAKSPLRGQVKPMLVAVAATETAAGALSAAGAAQLVLGNGTAWATWGAQLAALNVVMLFFGQRIAKDYVGAAALVPYFILSAGTVLLMTLGS
jgi:hypothetical protein